MEKKQPIEALADYILVLDQEIERGKVKETARNNLIKKALECADISQAQKEDILLHYGIAK